MPRDRTARCPNAQRVDCIVTHEFSRHAVLAARRELGQLAALCGRGSAALDPLVSIRGSRQNCYG